MTHPSRILEALLNLEDGLLADLEAVGQVKARGIDGRAPMIELASALGMHSSVDGPEIKANPGRVSVEALTRQAVTELDGSFGIGEVKAHIRMHSPRGFGDVAIRAQLKRLEQEGELVLTQQGLGRAGNQYAKTLRFKPSPLL